MSDDNILENVNVSIEKVAPGASSTTVINDFGLCANVVEKVFIHGGGNGEVEITGDKLKRRMVGTELTLSYLERALINTGIKVTVDDTHDYKIRPNYDSVLNNGLAIFGYENDKKTDEIKIVIINLSRAEKTIKRTDVIAVLDIYPKTHIKITGN